MAITSYGGFDGVPITEPEFGVSISDWATQMGVVSAGDWKVTAGTNPGQLNVDSGTGWGYGVTVVSDSISSVTQASLPAGAGATRWDLVAMRRDWQPLGGSCSFVVLPGSATKQLPPAAAAPGGEGMQVFPGVVHDQPLALVQWTAGQTQPTAIVDLRVWAGGGGLVAKDELVLTYVSRVGTRVKINGQRWSSELGTNDTPVWVNEDGAGPWVSLELPTGWVNNSGLLPASARLINNGSLLQVQADVRYAGGPAIYEGWILANLPARMRPASPTFVTGTTDSYRAGTFYVVHPGGISVGPFPRGVICQLNGLAAMR